MPRQSIAVLTLVCLLSLGSMASGGLVWYGTNTSAAGGDGPWDDGFSALWWNGSSFAGWGSGGDYAAVFEGAETSSNVAVDDFGIARVDSMTFNSTGYTLTGAAALPLTLSGAGPHVVTNADATIRAALGGTAGLIKAGAATLTLDGANPNTFTGLVKINEGTLSFDNLNKLNLANAANNVSLGTNTTVATLKYTGASDSTARTLTLGSLTAAANTIEVTSGDLTWTGAIGGGAGLGNTSLIVKGAGRFIPTSASSNYSGHIVIDGGTLVANVSQAMGTTSGAKNITLQNGGTIDVGFTYDPGTGTRAFVVGAGGGRISVGSGFTFTLNDAGQFGGSGDLTKLGDGRFIVGSDYEFTGNVAVTSGILETTNNSALAGVTTGTITVTGGKFVHNHGTALPNAVVLAGGSIGSRGGDRIFGGSLTLNDDATFVLADDGWAGSTTARSITVSGPLAGSKLITVVPGTGTTGKSLVLSGDTSAFTGNLLINAASNTLQLGPGASASNLNKPVTIGSGRTVTAQAGTINLYGTGTALNTVGTTIQDGAQLVAEAGGTITVGTNSDNNEFRVQVDDNASIWAKGGTITISGRATGSATFATTVGGDLKATLGGTVNVGANGSDTESRLNLLNTTNLTADGGTINLRNQDATLTLSSANVASITVVNGGRLLLGSNSDAGHGALNMNVVHAVSGTPSLWTLGKGGNHASSVFTVAHDPTGAAGIDNSKGLTLDSAIGTLRYNRPSLTIVGAFDLDPNNWGDGEVMAILRGGVIDISTAAGSTFSYQGGMTIQGWGGLGSTTNQTHIVPTGGVQLYANDGAATSQTLTLIGTLDEDANNSRALTIRIGDNDGVRLGLSSTAANPYVMRTGQITADAQTAAKNNAKFGLNRGLVIANSDAFTLDLVTSGDGLLKNKYAINSVGGTLITDLSGQDDVLIRNPNSFPTDYTAPTRMINLTNGAVFTTTSPTFLVDSGDAVGASGTGGTIWALPAGATTPTQVTVKGLMDVGNSAAWTVGGTITSASTGVFRLDGGEILTLAAGGDLTAVTLAYAGAPTSASNAVVNVNGANTLVQLGLRSDGTARTLFDRTIFSPNANVVQMFRTTAGTMQWQVAPPVAGSPATVSIIGTNQLMLDLTNDGTANPEAVGALSMQGGRFQAVQFDAPGTGVVTTVALGATLSGYGIYGQPGNVDTFFNDGTVQATGGNLEIVAGLQPSTDTVRGGITTGSTAQWLADSTRTLVLNGNVSDRFVGGGSPPTAFQLVWNQPGNLNLMQSNSYSGGTQIVQSTVGLYAANAVGTGSVTVSNSSTTADTVLNVYAANALGSSTVTASGVGTKDSVVQAFAAGGLSGGTVNLGAMGHLKLRNEVGTDFGGTLNINDATAKLSVDRPSGGTGTGGVLSVATLNVAPALSSVSVIQGPNGGVGYLLGATGTTTVGSATTAGDFTFNPAANVGFYVTTLNERIAGTNLVKDGAGTLVLAGPSNYTGTTTLKAGTLAFGANAPLPAGTTAVAVQGGALAAYGAARTVAYNLNVTGDFGFGGDQDLVLTGTVDLGGVNRSIALSNAGDVTLQQPLVNPAGLTTTGAGTGRLILPQSYTPPFAYFNGGNVHLPAGASLVVPKMNVGAVTTTGSSSATFTADGTATLQIGTGSADDLNVGYRSVDVAGTTTGVLDLRTLDNVSVNVGTLNIGVRIAGSGNTDSQQIGTVYLAKNATVNASTAVVINYNNKNGNSNLSELIVGSGVNTINTPTMTVGSQKASGGGKVSFTPGGTLNLGSSTARTNLYLGRNNLSTGTMSRGTFDVTGGTLVAYLGELRIAEKSGGSTGGAEGTFILDGAASLVDVNTVNVAMLSSTGTSTGLLHLKAGTMKVNTALLDAGGNSTVILDGATLDMSGKAIGSASNPIDVLTLDSGVLKNVGEINGGAPLTLNPAGALTIAGANTWTGETTIADGKTVFLAAGTTLGTRLNVGTFAGGGAVLDASAGGAAMTGGTLQGFGTVLGDVTIAAGGAEGAGGAGTVGTLTVGTLSSGSLTFDAGSILALDVDGLSGADLIDVKNAAAGSLNFAGATTVRVNPLGGFGAGNYAVLKYGAGGPAGIANLSVDPSTLPTGYNAGIVNNAGSSQIELAVVEAKRWYGATAPGGPAATTWDVGTTANWKAYVTGGFATYTETPLRDSVVFDDAAYPSGPASLTVNIASAVSPARVLVDNAGSFASGKDYTFTGAGIVGNGELVKRGGGSLTFSNAGNAWTGGAKLEGGAIYNGVNNALPTAGALTLGGTTADVTYDLNGFNQQVAGLIDAGVAVNRTVTNSGFATAALTLGGAGDYTFGGTITGNLNLVRSGTGSQGLTAANSFSGTTTIQSGTVAVGNDTALSFGQVNLTGNAAVLQLGAYVPGLTAGRLSGNQNWTGANPGTFIVPGPSNANNNDNNDTDGSPPAGTGWVDNTTWVYTGQIYFPVTGNVSFGKSFDDSYRLTLDGAVLVTHTTYNAVSVTTVPVTAGWHSFEARFAQGTGGVGPYAPWSGFGFGIDLTGSGSTAQSNYVYPTGEEWFRTANVSTLNLMNNINVSANATIAALAGVTASTTGALTVGGNVLTVDGGGSLTIYGATTMAGPTSPTFNVGAGTTLTLSGQIGDLGAGRRLQKSGPGTLIASYAFDNAFSGGVTVADGTLTAAATGRVLGTGGPVAVQAGATLRFAPTTAGTINMTGTTAVTSDGYILVTANNKADFGTAVIAPGGVYAAQPISALVEYGAKPSDVGLANYGTGTAVDPFIRFENAANFIAPVPGPGRQPQGTLGTGTLLSLDAVELNARAGNYFGGSDHVGVAWTGQLTVGGALPAGWVTFGTSSDDGSSLYVDYNGTPGFQADELVVNNFGSHGVQSRTGSVNLAAGTYNIAIGYYNGTGGSFAEARFGPGQNADYNDLVIVNPGGKMVQSRVQIDAGGELAAGGVGVEILDLNGSTTTNATLTLSAPGNSSAGHMRVAGGGSIYGANVNPVAGHTLTVNDAFRLTSGAVLNKGDAGTMTVAGNFAAGNNAVVNVAAGTVKFNLAATDTVALGANVTAKVAAGGTLELSGSQAALAAVAVTNDSSTLGVLVTGTNQEVASIAGIGTTTVATGADLTTNWIVQDTLTIGAGGSVTIRETPVAAGAAAGASAVPEPGTWLLIGIGLLSLLALRRRR